MRRRAGLGRRRGTAAALDKEVFKMALGAFMMWLHLCILKDVDVVELGKVWALAPRHLSPRFARSYWGWMSRMHGSCIRLAIFIV